MTRVAAILMVAFLGSCTKEPPPPPPSSEKPPSPFFRKFDRYVARDKVIARFSSSHQQGDAGDDKIPPSTRNFRAFYVRGQATEEAIRGITTTLKDDLLALAQSAGATIIQPPKEISAERLGAVPYPASPDLKAPTKYPNGLQGYYFIYKQGDIEGAVDILASHGTIDGRKEWQVVCALHEAR